MKKLLMMILAGSFAWAGSLQAGIDPSDVDLIGMGTYFVPEEEDIYDDAGGAEVRLQFWVNPTIGLALVGGWSRWNLDDQRAVVRRGDDFVSAEVEGEIDYMPVGASLLFRVFNTDRVALVLEGGARYVFVDDSESDVNVSIVGPGTSRVTRQRMKIDDGVVAIAAVFLELSLTDDVFLLLGGGYQWDLDEGDVNFLDEDIQDNKLEAAMAHAGLGIRF
jgi:hypothetical protein